MTGRRRRLPKESGRAKRLLIRSGWTLLVFVLVLSLTGIWMSRRSFPMVDGRVAVAGLDDEVEVLRDENGVAHIWATTEHDLYYAQGYVHAQERFWQMDFWRHIGQGRLSELFGESQVDTDIFLRSLGFAELAQREFTAAPARDQAVLRSYADGVNAYLAERSGSALSLEYAVLTLQNRGYEPEPWEPIDTLTWARMMAWELRSNMEQEIWRAVWAGEVGVERAERLIPDFPDDMLTILGGAAGGVGTEPPSSALMRAIRPALDELIEKDDVLQDLIGPLGAGIGSNNWVVSGVHTATGLPLLADDPHLPIQMPSIWFENGLHCASCGLEVVGFSFAGVPGVIIGHNDRIAWGVTNFGGDHMDLFIEKVNPDDDGQYEVNGQWEVFETRIEVIEVAGGDPVEIEVRRTRHGPVLTGIFGEVDDLDLDALHGEVPSQYVIALQWTALQPSTLVQAIFGINRAGSWEEFRAAAGRWDIAGQNLVYADVEGNIGYQATGRLPVRASGPGGHYPVPGWTTDHDWVDWVEFEDMPMVFNPEGGIIASANQAPWPLDTEPYLGVDFSYGYRGTRAYEMLWEADRPITAETFAEMQTDSYDRWAEEFLPALLALEGGETVRAAQDLLSEWAIGEDRFQAHSDSAPAALFYIIWQQTMAQVFEDELTERARPYGDDHWFLVVRDLLDEPDDAWWDDVATEGMEDRDALLTRVVEDAWAIAEERMGNDPEDWRWGDLHTATFENQTFGRSGIGPIEAIFNRGTFEPGGTGSVLNATRWRNPDSFEISWVPSMRMIVDLADFSASQSVHTTGQSGHAYHPHYIDQAELWEVGEYHPMRWTRAQVEADLAGRLVLVPEE